MSVPIKNNNLNLDEYYYLSKDGEASVPDGHLDGVFDQIKITNEKLYTNIKHTYI
jgi:hypothetical protein